VIARASLCGKRTLESRWLHFPRTFFQALAQYLLGAGMTFSATGSDAQIAAQCRHRRLPAIDRVPYFSLGNIVANANDHADTLLVSIRRGGKKHDSSLSNFL